MTLLEEAAQEHFSNLERTLQNAQRDGMSQIEAMTIGAKARLRHHLMVDVARHLREMALSRKAQPQTLIVTVGGGEWRGAGGAAGCGGATTGVEKLVSKGVFVAPGLNTTLSVVAGGSGGASHGRIKLPGEWRFQ